MDSDHPTPTFRGYRRQALYSLFRLFDDALPDGFTLHPEGKEDLAIHDTHGPLLEIVQVKDHSKSLSVSSFKPIFWQRIAPYCHPDSTAAVKVVSFGPIGADLESAKKGDTSALARVTESITNQGVSPTEVRQIIDHIQFVNVTEPVLTEAIVGRLKQTVTGVDATQAFDFLMWWLMTCSEQRRMISRHTAITKIVDIGRLLASRAAYHDEWYQSIVPIGGFVADFDTELLASEFYQGVRARYEHVAADLDIARERPLTRIHEAFGKARVVIVHSASGQGKSTLAYRYIKEFTPNDFRFEVKRADDLRHARRMGLALVGHHSAADVPTLVFVDVVPGDLNWIEVVRGLSAIEGIRVLVAIREEDWRRSNLSSTEFTFEDLELQFEREEAKSIYDSLVERTAARHLDFDEAWAQFGDGKYLLEFVHFVTQSQSLRATIAA